MQRSSTTAVALITAVLAILLVAYVFLGGSPTHSQSAPHCNSREALDQVKSELFRRAAEVRGTAEPAFGKVANYAVVRTQSRIVRRHHRGSSKVSCSGSIVLELPPGVAVAGGRRSLASNLNYDLEPQARGAGRLLTLSKADAIVMPLASISNVGNQTDLPLPAAQPEPVQADAASGPSAAPQPLDTASRPRLPPPPMANPPRARPRPAAPARTSAAQPPLAKPVPAPAAASPARRAAPATVATARPSFNCRYARSRSEMAVCGSPGLASLDRQMSSQFYGAMAAARPGQRAMLQRTRNGFLRYRDSCGSEACVANAYRARMREISDIMSGSW